MSKREKRKKQGRKARQWGSTEKGEDEEGRKKKEKVKKKVKREGFWSGFLKMDGKGMFEKMNRKSWCKRGRINHTLHLFFILFYSWFLCLPLTDHDFFLFRSMIFSSDLIALKEKEEKEIEWSAQQKKTLERGRKTFSEKKKQKVREEKSRTSEKENNYSLRSSFLLFLFFKFSFPSLILLFSAFLLLSSTRKKRMNERRKNLCKGKCKSCINNVATALIHIPFNSLPLSKFLSVKEL